MRPARRLSGLAVVIAALLLHGCERGPSTADTAANNTAGGNKTTSAKPLSALPADTITVVNGQAITQNMLALYKQARTQQEPHAATDRQNLVNEMINLVLLAQSAEKAGMANDPSMQRQLEFQRTNLLAAAMVDKLLAGMRISDSDVQAAYDAQYKNHVRREYKTRNILVSTRADALAVISALEKGADFAQLAREKSIGPAAGSGGALQWFQPKDVLPQFANAVAALPNGQYSRTPVKTRYGWNVILREDARDIPPPPIADVASQLRVEIARDRLDRHIDELRRHAEINNQSPLKNSSGVTSTPDPRATKR